MARCSAVVLVGLLTAALWAQDKPGSFSRPASHAKSSIPEPGGISDGVYRNAWFGFSYKLPYGWVDRTREMQDDSGEASQSLLLLAIFERPPEAAADSLNSAVVIAAEPLSAYPGLKTAADYLGALTELATAKGFQPEGEARNVSIGTTQLVRADFAKARGSITVRQTSLVILEKTYEVSFTFIGGSEDEVDELIEKLSFASRKPH